MLNRPDALRRSCASASVPRLLLTAIRERKLMSTYRAPLRDMQFVLRELAGIDDDCETSRLRGHARRSRRDSRRSRDVCQRSARPDQSRSATSTAARGTTARSPRRPASKKRTRSSPRPAGSACPFPTEYGGQGLPQLLLGPALEMWNGRQHRLRQRSAAQSRRDRSDRTVRLRRAEAHLHSQARVAASGRGTM